MFVRVKATHNSVPDYFRTYSVHTLIFYAGANSKGQAFRSSRYLTDVRGRDAAGNATCPGLVLVMRRMRNGGGS